MRTLCAALTGIAALTSIAGAQAGRAAPVPPPAGSYQITGLGDDGSRNTGTSQLALVSGTKYSASWVIGPNTYAGVCINTNPTVSCVSCPQGGAHAAPTLFQYFAYPDRLDGITMELAAAQATSEFLLPAAPARLNYQTLLGTYTARRTVPGTAPTTGTVAFRSAIPKPGTFTIEWTFGAVKSAGIAIRGGATADVVTAATCAGAVAYSAIDYTVTQGGKVLNGKWIQTVNGRITTGTEVMMRQ